MSRETDKSVYLVYETDSSHDARTRVLVAAFTTKPAAINAIVKNAWGDYADNYNGSMAETKREIRDSLEQTEQTQHNCVCHEIREMKLNEWKY